MALDDDVRKCCDDIDEVRESTQRLKATSGEDTAKDLSNFEAKFERFVNDAKEAREKLDTGLRDGLDRLITAWFDARERIRAHLRLIEAKGMLASARRLATDQYFVAAESELTKALQLVHEASALLPGQDAHLAELANDIEQAVTDIRAKARSAASTLEKVFARNERLLAELDLSV